MIEIKNFKGVVLQTVDAANLQSANLQSAYLIGADLQGANLPSFQICPERGSFLAYKKLANGIALLRIPREAKRTSSLVGRKCRAEYALVLGLRFTRACFGNEVAGVGYSQHDRGKTAYVKGQIVRPDSYDGDIRVECAHGIHFFMTKAEALAY